MNDCASVNIQQTDKTLTVCFLESRLNGVRNDNEPWGTIELSLQTSMPDTLLLDFSNVTVLCSAVLAKIVGLKRKFNGEIVLANLSELLTEVVHITGLDRLFTVRKVG